MKFRTLAVCSLVLVFAVPAFAEETVNVKPGNWQWTMQMDIPGMPFKMPPMKFVQCVKDTEAKSIIPQDKNSKDCKIGETKVSGNTITWTMDCPKEKMTGTGEMTYTEESMTGALNMNKDGQDMKVKYDGKRLGDCKE